MAWVEKMPSGRFRGCYRDTARRKLYVTNQGQGFGRKTDAREAAQEAEVRSRREAALDQGTLSARTQWGDWWDLIRPERLESDSHSTEYYIVKQYLRAKWGEVPLNKITHKTVQKWVTEELTPGRKASYVRRIYSLFSMSMGKAVKEEVLTASPCARIRLPTIRKGPKPYVDEVHLQAIGQPRKNGRPNLPDPAYEDLLDLGYETGMRPGELCGLHANRIDLATGWVTVVEVLVNRRGVIRPCPKDKDARRVPLTAKAAEILGRLLADRDLTGGCGVVHTDDKSCHSELVIRNRFGKPVTPHALYQAMTRAAGRADLPKLSPYAVRRGFFTWAAEGGLDPFAMKAIGGHASMDQTDEYVQQTSTARDRLRSARGEHTALHAIQGARGAEQGADPGKQATQSDAIDASRDAG